MYPNPQEALPLSTHPTLAEYEARANDLVKACESRDPDAIGRWARELYPDEASLPEFAERTLKGEGDRRCRLTDAQLVIARAHGFLSWATFAAHLGSLAQNASPVSAFERAADAIVAGDAAALQQLLHDNPDLVRARSTREHGAALLHYVSANGVEGYRQKSPRNAPAIAEILLQAGAEVDPEAEVYGGGCTPLGLVATSTPPLLAGVQREVIDVLLAHGARMDHPGSTGNNSALVRGCLMNGCPEAAGYLADRGAPLDLAGAAGIGRLDAVKRFVSEDGTISPQVSKAQLEEALALAAGYGQVDVVNYLLDRGIEVDRELRLHGDGHTALHVASFHGHSEVARSLIQRGADVNRRDRSWKTPPLYWALAGWRQKSNRTDERYYELAALLVASGATVTAELLDWEWVRSDGRMHAALTR